jgi:cytochrome b pre-mRNA-processing protein 3
MNGSPVQVLHIGTMCQRFKSMETPLPGPFNQWLKFFTPRAHTKAANGLYLATVAQSRLPAFYTVCEVPDSVDGRFDMVAIHCFLVMHRLKDQSEKADKVAQVLFDEMFSDMDRGLRELGVGDMGVGKRVRAMAKAYMGRVEVYDEALLQEDDADLCAALGRNLYRGADVSCDVLAAMALYMRQENARLAGQTEDALLKGNVSFSAPPESVSTAQLQESEA